MDLTTPDIKIILTLHGKSHQHVQNKKIPKLYSLGTFVVCFPHRQYQTRRIETKNNNSIDILR